MLSKSAMLSTSLMSFLYKNYIKRIYILQASHFGQLDFTEEIKQVVLTFIQSNWHHFLGPFSEI